MSHCPPARLPAAFLLTTMLLIAACSKPPAEVEPMNYPAPELVRKLATGELSATQVTQYYLSRIESLDRHGPQLKAVLELNPAALEEAAALTARRHRTRGAAARRTGPDQGQHRRP